MLMLGFNNIKPSIKVFLSTKTCSCVDQLQQRFGISTKNTNAERLFLDARNNSVAFPVHRIGASAGMRSLYLNGNLVGRNGGLPEKISDLASNLVALGISECNLESLPSYFSSFDKMKYLDVRNNRISSLPNEVIKLIRSSGMEAYFHNNTGLCGDLMLGQQYCAPLCSRYCYSRKHKNGHCDDACNSKECRYDGGDCTGL